MEWFNMSAITRWAFLTAFSILGIALAGLFWALVFFSLKMLLTVMRMGVTMPAC